MFSLTVGGLTKTGLSDATLKGLKRIFETYNTVVIITYSLFVSFSFVGLSRYANTPGSISTKSTPMTPVLDPFGKPANKPASTPGNVSIFF